MCCTHLRLTQATGTKHHASKPSAATGTGEAATVCPNLELCYYLQSCSTCLWLKHAGKLTEARAQPRSHFACVFLSNTLIV